MSARDDYLAGHVEEALTHAGETDVQVRVLADRVVLTGTVATDRRRDEVMQIASGVVTDLSLDNEVTVLSCREPEGDEVLP